MTQSGLRVESPPRRAQWVKAHLESFCWPVATGTETVRLFPTAPVFPERKPNGRAGIIVPEGIIFQTGTAYKTLRKKLVEDGAIFYTTSDTETIVQLIAKSKRVKTIDKVVDAIFQIQGGYALVMLTQKSLIGVRDPFGIRPLIIGKLKNSYVLASETCALDIIGAKFVREVDNGEIVLIEKDKLESIKPFPPKKVRPCSFLNIFILSRPDSMLDGKTAYEHRKNTWF